MNVIDTLTNNEMAIAIELARGRNVKSVAASRNISCHAVDSYFARVCRKLFITAPCKVAELTRVLCIHGYVDVGPIIRC